MPARKEMPGLAAGWRRTTRVRPIRARQAAAPNQRKPTYGGVDAYGNTKEELYERAKKLGVEGRSKMNKDEPAQAIARKQR